MTRKEALEYINRVRLMYGTENFTRDSFAASQWFDVVRKALEQPEQRVGHCKDCRHFDYDHVANIDGIPLIVAHEICNKWGDGCKTKENGYCFMFKQKMVDEEVQE